MEHRVKLFCLGLFAVVALTIFKAPLAHAATPPDSCFSFNAGTHTIEDYYDNEGGNGANPACTKDVDIPTTIGGVAVTAIGNNSFSDKQLTSVTIPDSVITIGDSTFYNNQLTSLILGNSVTTIGASAFNHNQLTSVIIPNSVITISNNAFLGNQLTSLTLGNSVSTIGESAFYYSQLTSLTIPDSVTSVGDFAFAVNQITTLSLGSSLTTIGNYAFYSNQLTTLTIPNSVTTIGLYTFGLNGLTGLTLGSSVATIGDFAFAYNQLTTLTIPNSVASIGGFAFIFNSSVGRTVLIGWLESGNPTQVQQALDAISVVNLSLASSSNPNGLQDSILTEADFYGADFNGNGNQSDVLGGHRIILSPSQDGTGGVTSNSSTPNNIPTELAATGMDHTFLLMTSILAIALPLIIFICRYKFQH